MILALAGGVGGAKLAHGLAAVFAPGQLHIVVNTGDDFEHLGLSVSPDLDTVMYTLAGLADAQRGWGRAGESWACMEALAALGGETWFALGDRDLAVHLERTRRLRAGEALEAITADFCHRLGIAHRIAPMSSDPVRTQVHTDQGVLAFQEYFVRRRCEPRLQGLSFRGAEQAVPGRLLMESLCASALEAIVLCPSNPWLSIGPILAMPAVAAAIDGRRVPVIAVSPIIGGEAVKGPAAKIMAELGLAPGVAGVAAYYGNGSAEGTGGRRRVDHWIIDERDAQHAAALSAQGLGVTVAQTLMRSEADRRALAQVVRDVLPLAACTTSATSATSAISATSAAAPVRGQGPAGG